MAIRPPTPAARTLARRCREFGARAKLARALSVTQSTITRWCDGYCVPHPDRRAAIERETGISAHAWEVRS